MIFPFGFKGGFQFKSAVRALSAFLLTRNSSGGPPGTGNSQTSSSHHHIVFCSTNKMNKIVTAAVAPTCCELANRG